MVEKVEEREFKKLLLKSEGVEEFEVCYYRGGVVVRNGVLVV